MSCVLSLDHVFVFVEDPVVAAAACEAHGLHASFGREHPGQGTHNRLVLFPDHYLELIGLRDRNEAEKNLLRLDRRADHRLLGTSPIGIGLRGQLPPTTSMRDWRRYHLEGFRAGSLWIWESSLDDPRLPLIFCIVATDQSPTPRPRDHGFADALFQHPCGATGIRHVELRGPGHARARLPWLPKIISVIDDPEPSLKLEVIGAPGFVLDRPPLRIEGR